MINKNIFLSLSLAVFIITPGLHLATPSIKTQETTLDETLTLEINHIRYLEDIPTEKTPEFYVKVIINNEERRSPTCTTTAYIYNLGWATTYTIQKNSETIPIIIQLWNKQNQQKYDISGTQHPDAYQAQLTYDRKNGRWKGDDHRNDPSGYGRLNGCDDGTIYTNDYDCELWFSIKLNDQDGDHIPSWIETHQYHTNPMTDDTGTDTDADGIPIEWEHHWGYDPTVWDDHEHLDPDNDGLNNLEEYQTTQWDSDPFRKDLFLELDQMDHPANDNTVFVTQRTKEMLQTAYNRQNVVYHLDDGCMGGGEIIPFDRLTGPDELTPIYESYFLHHQKDNWRRGVFHYGVIINKHFLVDGHAFPGEGSILDFSEQGVNCFQVSRQPLMQKIIGRNQDKIDFYYACLIMHETGHTLGLYLGHPPGCDNQFSKYPWQIGSFIYRNYRSVMNYQYTYHILDYSDGTHGPRDFDDWSNLDFTFFQPT